MASLKDIKVNINVDTTDFIKSLRQLQENIKMDNVRILNGYSENEQKELEDSKKKYMKGSDLLHIITSFPSDTESDLIWQKYDKADKDEQISIIKDILDFYTDKAKFPEQKYYVHLIKDDEYSYLNITPNGGAELDNKFAFDGWRTKFTREEIISMNPQLVPFMEEIEK